MSKIPFVHHNDLLSYKLVGTPLGYYYRDGAQAMRWAVEFDYPKHTTVSESDGHTGNYVNKHTLKPEPTEPYNWFTNPQPRV